VAHDGLPEGVHAMLCRLQLSKTLADTAAWVLTSVSKFEELAVDCSVDSDIGHATIPFWIQQLPQVVQTMKFVPNVEFYHTLVAVRDLDSRGVQLRSVALRNG